MIFQINKNILRTLGIAVLLAGFTSCTRDGNPNDLPDVSPDQYEGKIDGFSSSDEIFPSNLVAYWSFDNTNKEIKSGKEPTLTSNNSFIPAGIRGGALALNNGWLYYGENFDALKADTFKSFTISSWVQIQNNGTKRTMLFQLARPGQFNGSINIQLNTQAAPTTSTVLRIQPLFTTVGGGFQDNLNSVLSPVIGADKWTHILITYNGTSGVFDLWTDGVKTGAFPNRGVGNNLFKAGDPNEIIIGANYNSIPGKTVNTDVNFAPMTGNVDEMRIYNRPLPDAFIRALYNLGRANK